MSGSVQSRRLSYSQCEIDFQLELSRGASCIASCQQDASLREEVERTVLTFLETHGANRLEAFLDVLAARLDARGRRDVAEYVRRYPLPPEQ
ncbi:hypothetical protein EVC45_27550 [Paraburkholderia sp. UYCP14C]|uniref:hypothetical protein n=1 Tax=Paraburkholderia sp. UYCP14C TaxID=2511130 RepID=UPI001020897B|nr:hypothetical protein [Paraburkholderia sp. UYCP14C]RZF26486.1 hypothetical protein EVC45_27550 [Paraburkholderia sp. UYCP14C]